MPLFEKVPSPVEAIQFDGANDQAVKDFIGDQKALFNAKEKQIFVKDALHAERTVHATDWLVKLNPPNIDVMADADFKLAYRQVPDNTPHVTQGKPASPKPASH
jgi:hypothetical protein